MDSNRFDKFTMKLAGPVESRRSALKYLAVGVAALTGITLATGDSEARKKNKKRKICKCTSDTLESCRTRKIKRKKFRKQTKRFPCSYGGRCRNFNPCAPGGACSVNTDCPGGQQCINATCTRTCTGNGQCASGQVCLNGSCATACTAESQCLGGQVCVNGACVATCVSDTNCTGPQRCLNGVCAVPPAVSAVCTRTADCTGALICVAGACVAGCATNADCTGGLVCGDLLGNNVCVGAQCSEANPCAGGALASVCLLGICVEL